MNKRHLRTLFASIILVALSIQNASALQILLAEGSGGTIDVENRLTGLGHTVTTSNATTWNGSFDYSVYDVVAFQFQSANPLDIGHLVDAVTSNSVGVVFLRGSNTETTASAFGLITGGQLNWQTPTDLDILDNSHPITTGLSLGIQNLGYLYMTYVEQPGASGTVLATGPNGAALIVHNTLGVVITPFYGHPADYDLETANGLQITENSLQWAASGVPPTTYTVGGTVSGLTGSVTLQNNGGDDIIKTTNDGFTFTAQAEGSDYAVTVSSQPTGQTCTVTNGSGTNITANITNVTVTCVTDVVPTYSVGGTVSGLTGSGLALQNNGGDTLAVAATAFTFATELEVGFSYVVTVSTEPTGQTCTVSNGSGTISDADVTDVAVTCTDNPEPLYTINGSASGLGPNSVTLQNNLTDDLVVSANGVFVFATALPDGSTYDVTVLTQPTGQTCDVTNGFGTINGSDVLGVDVDCVDDVVTPPPSVSVEPIPTLSEWTLILLTMLIGLMVFANRRRLF